MTKKEILEKTIDFDDAIHWIVKLEKEKCELLGLIQAKDKLIEKMKRCKNCEFSIPICDTHCQDCDEHYSNWRLAE